MGCDDKKGMGVKDVQRLATLLKMCPKCVGEGRLFFSRILSFLKYMSANGNIKIPTQVRKDISWWVFLIYDYNGRLLIPSKIWQNPGSELSKYACVTWGSGHITGNISVVSIHRGSL